MVVPTDIRTETWSISNKVVLRSPLFGLATYGGESEREREKEGWLRAEVETMCWACEAHAVHWVRLYTGVVQCVCVRVRGREREKERAREREREKKIERARACEREERHVKYWTRLCVCVSLSLRVCARVKERGREREAETNCFNHRVVT